jgi:hypothetical protein
LDQKHQAAEVHCELEQHGENGVQVEDVGKGTLLGQCAQWLITENKHINVPENNDFLMHHN